jgi:type I restriction enzyme R subunit
MIVLEAKPDNAPLTEGVAQEKLTPLLRLRYQNFIADAVADLGKPEDIGQLFSGFQRFLDAAST